MNVVKQYLILQISFPSAIYVVLQPPEVGENVPIAGVVTAL